MRINIDIDDRIVAAFRRVFRRANLAIVVAALLSGAAVVYATPIVVDHSFSDGDIISSTEVNENFAKITEASVYTNPTGKKYTLNAAFCGNTTATSMGDLGGYAGAKTQCEAVATCTETAHMCTAVEIVRFVSTGGTMPAEAVWYATGVVGEDNGRITDCSGWTTATVNERGARWNATTPDSQPCSAPQRVACCD